MIDHMDWIVYFRNALSGLSVSHVWRGYGSALFLEIGELAPPTRIRRDGSLGAPSGEIGVMIESSWRIEDERSIICGSESEEELWCPSFDRLVGQKVIDLTLFGRMPEVLLSLSGGLHVASLMTSDGEPAWTLFDRRASPNITVGCLSGTIQQKK